MGGYSVQAPYFLLQEVLGQWSGGQFLDHQVCSLLADTGGQASRCGQLASSWPDAIPEPLNSSGFPETEVMSCELNYCDLAWGLGGSLTLTGPQCPHLYHGLLIDVATHHARVHVMRYTGMANSSTPHVLPRDLPVFTRGFCRDAVLSP